MHAQQPRQRPPHPLAIAAPAGDTRPAIGSGSGFAATQSYLAPRCAAICKITMGITMGYMLILML